MRFVGLLKLSRPIVVDRILLTDLNRRFVLSCLDVHRDLLFLKGIGLRNHLDYGVKGNLKEGNLLQLDAEEIREDATENCLVPEQDDRLLLPFNPVDKGLKSSDDIHVRFAARISEVQFVLIPFLRNIRILLTDLIIGELLADPGVQLIEDSQLYMVNGIQFQEGSRLNGPLQCASQHDDLFGMVNDLGV